jgi:hypothetical protein
MVALLMPKARKQQGFTGGQFAALAPLPEENRLKKDEQR